jgi:hypothetical protein
MIRLHLEAKKLDEKMMFSAWKVLLAEKNKIK